MGWERACVWRYWKIFCYKTKGKKHYKLFETACLNKLFSFFLVVKCSPPLAIQNGMFDPMDESYEYNQAVTYSCTGSYTLIGESVVTCSDNGTFHPSPPKCLCELHWRFLFSVKNQYFLWNLLFNIFSIQVSVLSLLF